MGVIGLFTLLAAAWALNRTSAVTAWRSSAEAWKQEKDAAITEADRLRKMLTYEREEIRALRLENRHLYNRTDLTPLLTKQTETQESLAAFMDSNAKATRSLARTMGEVARALKVQTDETNSKADSA